MDDIVNANLLALKSEVTGIFNIGTNVEISDQQIFDLLSYFYSYNGCAAYVDERPGEITRMCLDNTRASRVLGWTPITSFEDGIASTVSFYSGRIIPVPETMKHCIAYHR